MLESHGDFATVSQFFFDAGVCKRISGHLLSQAAGIPLRQARRIIHESEAFRAWKEADEIASEEFFDELESLGTKC